MTTPKREFWEITASLWDNKNAQWRFHDAIGKGFDESKNVNPPVIKVISADYVESLEAKLEAAFRALDENNLNKEKFAAIDLANAYMRENETLREEIAALREGITEFEERLFHEGAFYSENFRRANEIRDKREGGGT